MLYFFGVQISWHHRLKYGLLLWRQCIKLNILPLTLNPSDLINLQSLPETCPHYTMTLLTRARPCHEPDSDEANKSLIRDEDFVLPIPKIKTKLDRFSDAGRSLINKVT